MIAKVFLAKLNNTRFSTLWDKISDFIDLFVFARDLHQNHWQIHSTFGTAVSDYRAIYTTDYRNNTHVHTGLLSVTTELSLFLSLFLELFSPRTFNFFLSAISGSLILIWHTKQNKYKNVSLGFFVSFISNLLKYILIYTCKLSFRNGSRIHRIYWPLGLKLVEDFSADVDPL